MYRDRDLFMQKLLPSRFAARERCSTCDIMLDQARSAQGKSRGQSRIGLALRWSRLIEHDITRGTAFFSPRISMMVLFFVQGSKSKQACLHRRGAREKLGNLNINTSIFLLLRKNMFNRTILYLWRKSWGHRPFWENPFFLPIHSKTRMLFGQDLDGEAPRNLNNVYLRRLEHGFNKRLGRLCSKIKITDH